MTFEELSSPTIVAKWFDTTPNNIRRTYMKHKPHIYKVQCIASFVMENNINADDLFMVVDTINKAKGISKCQD